MAIHYKVSQLTNGATLKTGEADTLDEVAAEVQGYLISRRVLGLPSSVHTVTN